MKNPRRGFTVLLGFLVVLIFVFATIMAQTNEMLQLLHMQKQAMASSGISIQAALETSLSAEKENSIR